MSANKHAKKASTPSLWRTLSQSRGSLDRVLLFLVVAFILFGILMVFSASAPWAIKEKQDPNFVVKRDLVWGVLSILTMGVVSRIPFSFYRRHAFGLYALSLLLCLLCFAPIIGAPTNNAHRWIGYKAVTLMPSDYLKISSVMVLAAFFTKGGGASLSMGKRFLLILVFAGVTLLPIIKQPNFSAVVVIGATIIAVYFMAGMKWPEMIVWGILIVLALLVAFWPREGNYRLTRLLVMLDPFRDPLNEGWQLLQSLFAVSTGRLFGVGFGMSRQKFDYLADEPHNDFIFAVLCEELGFVGALLFILFYAYMIYRMIQNVRKNPDPFSRLLGFGLTFIIAFQALVNIGVSIGFVPPTGITLPFISYGGSSLLAVSVMMGMILQLSRTPASPVHRVRQKKHWRKPASEVIDNG